MRSDDITIYDQGRVILRTSVRLHGVGSIEMLAPGTKGWMILLDLIVGTRLKRNGAE